VDHFFPSHFSASSWHGPQAFRSSSSSHYAGGIACVARCSRLMLPKITCLQSEAVKISNKKCTLSKISFRIAGNDKLHALIDEVLPDASRLLIKTHYTVAKHIKKEHDLYQEQLEGLLATSRSSIHFTYDPWAANYGSHELLSIIARFIASDGMLSISIIRIEREGRRARYE
jgi:hypothetical protein